MGSPIALRLQACGYPVVVYNRTIAKTQPLQVAGIRVVEPVSALIRLCDVILLTLTDAPAIAALLFDPAHPLDLDQKTVIQMGTISPAESQTLAQQVAQRGGEYLEAPVLGSIPEAQAGTLLVMVGGEESQFERWLPLFEALGTAPRHIGAVGTAAALKLGLNQLIGALTAAFSTSLAFVQGYEVPVDLFMAILRESALYAPTFDKKLPRIQAQNFQNPNFPTKHLLKDLRLFCEAAQEVQLELAPVQALCQILEQAMVSYADQDYCALSTAVNPGAVNPGTVNPGAVNPGADPAR
ncbi:NAD(P)-dependent oxidoreductase [Lyngbya confervoides BDU141951]|uniref:NAD(P)-dependent oxidoreductase n=2 Tax=Lyngbya TaxID=28073 RepID=A0ABD4SZ18_9CYAN|nr:NAD(P)-dependent oxidoreductase [Lyngbya confervoides BDU141951]